MDSNRTYAALGKEFSSSSAWTPLRGMTTRVPISAPTGY